VVLLGELLRGKLVELDHFLGQGAGIDETFSKEHDLSDKSVVGDHHRNGSEKYFQVVGQFSSPSITRIHSDEYAAGWDQRNNVVLEKESLKLLC
jgi:hypothetical protein